MDFASKNEKTFLAILKALSHHVAAAYPKKPSQSGQSSDWRLEIFRPLAMAYRCDKFGLKLTDRHY